MVKKSILAIAMLALLATVSFGAYDPNTGIGTDTGQYKADNGWPIKCEWIPVDICKIPVRLKIGYFIEVRDCGNSKVQFINLKQVTCPSGQSFPCYTGCVTIKVRANFEAQLGCRVDKVALANGKFILTEGLFGAHNYKCYFLVGDQQKSTFIVTGDGVDNDVKVCVDAWNADIFFGNPAKDNNNPKVADLVITAMPTGTPVCVDP